MEGKREEEGSKEGNRPKKKFMMRRVENNSRRRRTGRELNHKTNKDMDNDEIERDLKKKTRTTKKVQYSTDIILLTFDLVSLIYHIHHIYHTIVLVKRYHHPIHVMYSYWHRLLI